MILLADAGKKGPSACVEKVHGLARRGGNSLKLHPLLARKIDCVTNERKDGR
jgi:hypothetical protein